MIRRIMTTVLLVSIFTVVVARTGFCWTLTTKVTGNGGTLISPNKPTGQTSGTLNGTVTTTDPIPITFSTSSTYGIKQVLVTNTSTQATIATYDYPASPLNFTVQGPPSLTVAATTAAVTNMSATTSTGGSVYPTSNLNKYLAGQPIPYPLVFTFTPSPGYRLSALSGFSYTGGVTVSSTLPANVNTPVTVTFPAQYTFGTTLTLSGTFVASPVVDAGPDQTVATGSLVTLTASYNGSGTPTYFWSQRSGPATVNLATNGNVATFTPTLTGRYVFQVTVNNDIWDLVNIEVSDSLAAVERSQCQSCHNDNHEGLPQLFPNWSSSTHKRRHVMCYDCHVGTNSGSHPGILVWGSVNESTFDYTGRIVGASGNFCLGTCHAPTTPYYPGTTHVTVGMTCATCHNGTDIHNPDANFTAALTVCFTCHGGPNHAHYYTASMLTNQCLVCHNSKGHDPVPSPSVTAAHFNGYTSYSNPAYAAAYVTARTACSDCHKGGDPASTDDAAIKQFRVDWAASGHGDVSSIIWKNSSIANWKSAGTAGAVVSSSAAYDCVRCHTSLGYQQYLAGGALAPVGDAGDHSAEPLDCGACHNPDFTVRLLPAQTAWYNYSSEATGKLIVNRGFPDLKKSNVCVPCHSGRAGGDTIKAIAASTRQQSYSSSFWRDVPFVDGHSYTAAGQLIGATGYQYPGPSYDSAVGHATLAVAAGTGPCVACHMQGTTHSYRATAGSVCDGCHTDGNMSSNLTARQQSFRSALAALQAALNQKGFAPLVDGNGTPVYPYFNNTAWGDSATGPGNMGAAMNFITLTNDPGAFAHNPTYVKRLIRDSIDWLMNGSVDRGRDLTGTIASLPISGDVQSGATGFIAGSANGSSSCFICHENSVDQAGNEIVATYNATKHASDPKGPSCAGCHVAGDQAAHPPGGMLVSTADVSQKCQDCHKDLRHTWKSQGICTTCHNGHNPKNMTIGFPHYMNYTSAQFVTPNVGCANCHYANEEDETVTFNIYSANRQWGRSGKSDPYSPAYVSFDFKALGTAQPASPANSAATDCVRCHTTTGYINYVSSNFQDIHAWGISGLEPGGDRTREMIACSACHNPTPFNDFDGWETDDWGEPLQPAFARRTVPQVTAYYNYSAPGTPRILNSVELDDQGASNNCIVCHTGTAAGSTLKKIGGKVGPAGSFWSSTPFIDSHGMGGAGILYARSGYTYPTTKTRSYTPPNGFAHPFIDDAYYGGQGPCVACHLYTSRPHVFSPVSSASGSIAKIIAYDDVCIECHDGSSHPVDLSNPANLEAKKQGFISSLKALAAVLADNRIYFNPGLAPYFFSAEEAAQQGPATVFTNWNLLHDPNNPRLYMGADVMGAAFNLRLLWADAGAYAHNSYYVKRLIYDSIDFMDDGLLNRSVYGTIQNHAVTDKLAQGDKERALLYVGFRP